MEIKKGTVVGRMLRECRIGLAKRYPILWLRTDELSVVREILKSERLCTRLELCGEAGEEYLLPARPAGELREITSSLGGGCNFVHTTAEELLSFGGSPYFTRDRILRLTRSKDSPPYLFLLPMEERANGESDGRLSEALYPFLEAYVADATGESPIARSAVILYGEKGTLPNALLPYVYVVEEPYPDRAELSALGEKYLSELEDREALIEEMIGFPVARAERLMAYLQQIYADADLLLESWEETTTPRDIIVAERAQELKRTELLELIDVEKTSSLAGADAFNNWVDKQRICLTSAKEIESGTGAKAPRGVLLCGVPGTGKSLAAKSFAKKTGLKLLRMDIGRLMGGLLGDSEHNMDKALRIADATAPCVLFIDELDKALEGAKSNNGNGNDTFRRMFARLLGWMQEHESACFVFATANDISALPKELFRSGRFDAAFSMFLPTYEEGAQILAHHLERRTRGRECLALNVETLSRDLMNVLGAEKRFVTGSDIEKLVNMTLQWIYLEPPKDLPVDNKAFCDFFRAVLCGNAERKLPPASVYGDSEEQMDAIAMCYIRLLRGSFLPTTTCPTFKSYTVTERPKKDDGEEREELPATLPRFDVRVEINDAYRQVDANGKKNTPTAYDLSLSEELKRRIELLAPVFEQTVRQKMIGE